MAGLPMIDHAREFSSTRQNDHLARAAEDGGKGIANDLVRGK